jgi:hypothetical protein
MKPPKVIRSGSAHGTAFIRKLAEIFTRPRWLDVRVLGGSANQAAHQRQSRGEPTECPAVMTYGAA